jgi:hypothetical protein
VTETSYVVEHGAAGLGDTLEEWIRSGQQGWLLVHHPECEVYAEGAGDEDCDCEMIWIGPFGAGLKA